MDPKLFCIAVLLFVVETLLLAKQSTGIVHTTAPKNYMQHLHLQRNFPV